MNVLIAEDEQKFSVQLSAYLERFARENGLALRVSVYQNGAELAEKYKPEWDLLLLDVDMPGLDGFSAAKSIRKVDPNVAIIFITNLAQYAIRGYTVHALDYILKPISYLSFSMKLKRELGTILSTDDKAVFVRKDGVIQKLVLSRLYYVEVYNHSLRYHTQDGLIETTGSRTLGDLEKELSEDGFFRCHSSFLVNLRFVNAIGEKEVDVAGTLLPVSRNRRKAFLDALLEKARRT